MHAASAIGGLRPSAARPGAGIVARIGAPITALVTALLLFVAGAPPATAQQAAPDTAAGLREVIAKEIDVSRRGAALRLELDGGGTLEIELEDGSVLLEGDEIGSYPPGGALESTWRALLGEAVTLDDGPLARRLRGWAPPAGLPAPGAALARRLDEALEAALSPADAAAGNARLAQDRLATLLAERPERLLELARAVQGVTLDEVRVHVGENVAVAAGEVVDGSLVLVDGELEVQGEINGSVVVVGGTLRLSEGGRVRGDARLADARVFRDGGHVLGDLTELPRDTGTPAFLSGSERERLRRELSDELRQDLGRGRAIEQDIERDDAGGSALLRPVRRLGAAVGGVIELLIATLLIAVLGGGIALHFAREEIEVVGEAARRNPVQAGMVGLAGSFLIVPAYVLGMITLVITVVGILAVPFWIALFPAVVALAIALGYLAVALGVGEWVARQRVPKLEWVRLGNPYSTMIAGVGALMLAFLGARVLGAFGLLDILSGLLLVVGVLGTVAAALIGFGAVLMTHGGRRPAYGSAAGYWGEENWDDDLGMGSPPPASPPPPPPPPPQGADAGPTGGEDTTA